MKKNLDELLSIIHHSFIISCQALPGEPLYCEEMSLMPFMAKAAQMAGCQCIRTSSVRDVDAIKKETGLPVIGLIKRPYTGYDAYITPTMKEVDELMAVDSDVIALDCTLRKRGDGKSIHEFIAEIREKYPDIALMADISTSEEGINAWKAGVDIIGTTMSGYTPYSPQKNEPDYELVKNLVQSVPIPVIAEGKIHYPEEGRKMLELGAHAAVIGGAVTRPLEIARRFYAAIENQQKGTDYDL